MFTQTSGGHLDWLQYLVATNLSASVAPVFTHDLQTASEVKGKIHKAA